MTYEMGLNSTGCILLCQALITSAIQDNDRDFFSSQLGEIAKEIAVRKNNYNISKLIEKASHLPSKNSKKYDTKILSQEVLVFSIEELADKYHASPKDIRTALTKRNIPYGKKLIAN